MDFYTLAFLHVALTALYVLGNLWRKPRLHAATEIMIVLGIPFFGIILMLSYRLCCYVFKLGEGRQPEFEREKTAFFRGVQLNEDIIPLNDAFLVEDVQKKRHYFTDAIKQAVVDNEKILQMAMHDRDREVAYYAVALLTARMEKLENELFSRESSVISGENPENVPQLEEYAQLLKNYLEQKKFIDHVTYHKKQGDYIGLLDYLKQMCPEKIEYYTEEIRQLLETENYVTAELVCAELQEHFPQREESYMMYIRLYQSWRKPKQLQAKIRELKASPLELSQEALQAIRFWDKEAVKHG
ncbi:hypothetical protein SAMN05216582_10457 [Selenomonas ruminantium]|uniref:Uncharacterized protein n=1 Tax=Selenomonas ruminantium TaxID=971 RepID=A0A1M6SG53_SELRU|nr:hypothetical protein [Selenomonas ruminantium]SHK43655.1 hypothetical protein SAMN05216582_10457 [Selenomonas ruminantium]